MLRRTHKKSRNGCVECKRSRKKCDETHPECVNCMIGKKQCSYKHISGSKKSSFGEFVILTGSESPHTSNTSQSPAAAVPSQPPSPEHILSSDDAYVNMLHLELFQNVSSNAMSFLEEDSSKDLWVSTVLRYAFKYPYLMSSLLSLSAFHLSTLNSSPSPRHYIFLFESVNLQAHALSLFNASNPSLAGGSITNLTDENLNAAFLFSGALGMHHFCTAFSIPSPDLDTFLDRLLQSIHLLRGVRALIGNSWQTIRKSDIACLLQPESDILPPRSDRISNAFLELHDRFSGPMILTISPTDRAVYLAAISSLIDVYNSRPALDTTDGPPNGGLVTTWPITLSSDYTSLLEEKKPEALVVMAHFAVLLHWRRGFWPVGDAGVVLLGKIREELSEGPWGEWLRVPEELVGLV